MKSLSSVAVALAIAVLPFSSLSLHAQDQPPPPMDQSAAPPEPPDQGYAPQPGQDQGAPPPDQSAPPPDQGGDDSGASFDQFYNGLSNDGEWIQTPDYGYVFQPQVTDPNWAPYTEGHWVYTDYGWTWASDEPWGWATYHYGRWVNIDGTGWCWVPGYEWAPAWVSWRYGGGYCGWAPLPPSTFVGVEFGGDLGFDFHFGGDVDTAYGIGPGYYNFIPIGYIGDPSYHRYYMDRGRNFTIINHTTNITNIYVSRHPGAGAFSAVRVQGPALAQVNALSHTRVQQVRLAGTSQAGASRLSGGTLAVYAPHINAATAHTARPANVAQTLSAVKVNRGTNVSQPLQVNARYKPAAPSAEVVAAAREAQAHAPASVATASRIKPTARLSTPLSSLPTVSSQHRAPEAGGNAFAPSANAQVQHPANAYSNGNAAIQQQRPAETQQTPSFQNPQAEQQREEEVRQQQAATQQHSQQQHDEEVRQQQAESQAHAQQQAQAAAQERAQAQREDEVRQQQAESQAHAQAQVQAQQHAYQPEAVQQHVAQPQVQQHAPEQHAPAPAVHAAAAPAQHAQGGGGGNGNKNPNGAQSH